MQVLSHQTTVWVVFAAALLLTACAWYLSEGFIHASVRQRFDFQGRELAGSVAKHLGEYETVLRGSAGLLNASEVVSRDEWRQFVGGLRLEQTFPEVAALGFAPVVPAARLPAYLAQVRAEGFPEHVLYPRGLRDTYVPVLLIEPFDERNRRGMGFDAYSDPNRRQAMESARDTGEASISGKLRLVIDGHDGEPGFLMYVPVYHRGMPVATVEQRRKAIRGYVFSAFRARPFAESCLQGDLSKLDIELFDHRNGELLYRNFSGDASPMPDAQVITVPMAQSEWEMHLRMRPGYRTLAEYLQPLLIAVVGLVVNLLLFAAVWSLGRRKQQLEQRSGQLELMARESDSLLRSAIETIGEAFVVYDPQDRLTFCNEDYREVYKKSAPMIQIGRSFEEIIRYGAQRGQYLDAIGRVDEWVAERLALHLQGDAELIQRLDDGRWLKIRERKTPTGYIVGFRVDVTELYRAKEMAEAASQAKSRFLAMASHEIRTPMNGMLGMAQILRNPDLSPAERDEYVLAILRSGQTLLALLNDILDLSKVEAGKLELMPVVFSPAELMRESMQLFASAVERKQLSISCQSAFGDDGLFLADAMRLRQMLSNLIGNAIKFTEQGEIALSVTAMQGTEGRSMLEFSVRDSGIGITHESQQALFEPFSRVDGGVSHVGGAGLGLSIVRQLARLMGGEAGVESNYGNGARFWFRVMAESVAPDTVQQVAVIEGEGHELSHLQGRILVVEDDQINRKVIVGALRKMGGVVQMVENGSLAVDLIKAGESFDLILMDLSMPVMDGVTATIQIGEWYAAQGRSAPPIVAITANAFPDDRKRCEAVGMAAFLTKPVNFHELALVLGQLLPAVGPVAPAQAQGGLAPVDVDAAMTILRVLMPLLADHKFDAFARFKELKLLLAKTEVANLVEDIGRQLNRMAFDQVADRLRKLYESWGRSLSE